MHLTIYHYQQIPLKYFFTTTWTFLVITFGFGLSFFQVIIAAFGTAQFHRFIICDKFTVWIICAGIESSALFTSLLSNLTIFTIGTFHSQCDGFGKFAFGICRTRNKFTIPSMTMHQVSTAFWTFLI
jgi:hypothetical protein